MSEPDPIVEAVARAIDPGAFSDGYPEEYLTRWKRRALNQAKAAVRAHLAALEAAGYKLVKMPDLSNLDPADRFRMILPETR